MEIFDSGTFYIIFILNQYIQENAQNEEKLKGYAIQIDRQIDKFKNNYSQFDQKIKELNYKFLSILEKEGQEDYEAGKFLVEQISIIQEEKLDLISENEKMHKQLEEMNIEMQDQRNILDKYQDCFSLSEDKNQIIMRMKDKIEELEDFIVEIKEKGFP